MVVFLNKPNSPVASLSVCSLPSASALLPLLFLALPPLFIVLILFLLFCLLALNRSQPTALGKYGRRWRALELRPWLMDEYICDNAISWQHGAHGEFRSVALANGVSGSHTALSMRTSYRSAVRHMKWYT